MLYRYPTRFLALQGTPLENRSVGLSSVPSDDWFCSECRPPKDATPWRGPGKGKRKRSKVEDVDFSAEPQPYKTVKKEKKTPPAAEPPKTEPAVCFICHKKGPQIQPLPTGFCLAHEDCTKKFSDKTPASSGFVSGKKKTLDQLAFEVFRTELRVRRENFGTASFSVKELNQEARKAWEELTIDQKETYEAFAREDSNDLPPPAPSRPRKQKSSLHPTSKLSSDPEKAADSVRTATAVLQSETPGFTSESIAANPRLLNQHENNTAAGSLVRAELDTKTPCVTKERPTKAAPEKKTKKAVTGDKQKKEIGGEKNGKGTRPFDFFVREEKDRLLKDNPNMDSKDIKKLLSDKWKALEKNEKKVFEAKSKESKLLCQEKQGHDLHTEAPESKGTDLQDVTSRDSSTASTDDGGQDEIRSECNALSFAVVPEKTPDVPERPTDQQRPLAPDVRKNCPVPTVTSKMGLLGILLDNSKQAESDDQTLLCWDFCSAGSSILLGTNAKSASLLLIFYTCVKMRSGKKDLSIACCLTGRTMLIWLSSEVETSDEGLGLGNFIKCWVGHPHEVLGGAS
uniref:HMG box domain-containing protein n=1 Tax=Chromera velia CCMP2878 TaxID=1169474 RepID=A0A0G4HZD3_9ALVE|eukprot:Cvel_9706.t1-p1 / transcript=Cvel_9706.t1 / gene=Cvel_9706 / organism=Chromera_velia_CCMP2878 / gene_product=hypothetical protein / transcript_product=hypothetical protein / location=Cvel_scaffold566:16624-19201(+) / protein_length=568 / sequence_SO=supercontig / SO=protein_coding / is_pseudo=false